MRGLYCSLIGSRVTNPRDLSNWLRYRGLPVGWREWWSGLQRIIVNFSALLCRACLVLLWSIVCPDVSSCPSVASCCGEREAMTGHDLVTMRQHPPKRERAEIVSVLGCTRTHGLRGVCGGRWADGLAGSGPALALHVSTKARSEKGRTERASTVPR
ncbi:hypothetical protein O3P69_007059 [Scylla paramamosain]|uniref:Uncharacterized protein n=1 Tax=Scylla paramamosain TaxID=85552 RepID=A0AAW0V249_SCYPA